MGQQQLLLIVLSTIIVGVSIVVGINMFGQGAETANQDAVLQDLMTIGSRAQEWYRKPALLGGGGRDFTALGTATGLDSLLNFPSTNENGSYTVSSPAAGNFTVQGIGVESGVDVTVTIYPDSVGSLVIK